MKLKLYYFGKPREIKPAEQELIRRIGFRAEIELISLSQAGIKTSPEKIKQLEAEKLLAKITDTEFLIALDERGKQYDSPTFANWLKKQFVTHGTISLVIGGAYGLDRLVLERANSKLSFGSMVWTRNLVRHMTLEQLYRALEIDGGGNFHK